MDISLEKWTSNLRSHSRCGFSSFVSTRDPLNCSNIGVLKRCPHREISLSCPLSQRSGRTGAACSPCPVPCMDFCHVTRSVFATGVTRVKSFIFNGSGGDGQPTSRSPPHFGGNGRTRSRVTLGALCTLRVDSETGTRHYGGRGCARPDVVGGTEAGADVSRSPSRFSDLVARGH